MRLIRPLSRIPLQGASDGTELAGADSHMTDQPLETDRLRLRPLTLDDLPFFVALHADDRVARNLGKGRPYAEPEVRDWLAKTMAWQQREGLGHLGIVLKRDGRLIGRCGLNCYEVETAGDQPRAFWGRDCAPRGTKTTPILELGYTLHPDTWGQGFATEASRLMRDRAFELRGEERLMSVIRADNAPSIRVAQRNGFAHRGGLVCFDRPFERYELSRAAWERLRSRSADDAR